MYYARTLKSSRAVVALDVITTGGDLASNTTAAEICEAPNGEELLFVVIDKSGEQQVVFLEHAGQYHVSLSQLQEALRQAARHVVTVEWLEDYSDDD